MLSVNDTVRINKATTKYKQTNTKFVESFNMELAKQILRQCIPKNFNI